MRSLLLAAFVFVAGGLPVQAAEVHFAPTENLEHVDVGLLRTATGTIDVAAYVLSDWPVVDALIAAKERGVAVRIVLDPSQHHATERLAALADSIRVKRRGPIMHLKGYAIDDHLVRTGSANFTASGLKQQDNDLVVVDDPAFAARFEQNFERMWDAALPMVAEGLPTEGAARPAPVGLLAAPQGPVPPQTTAANPSACVIKGNLNRKGERIYHMPDQLDYGRVVMEGHPEKRWFCSEEEAVAAGWRKAMR